MLEGIKKDKSVMLVELHQSLFKDCKEWIIVCESDITLL